MCSLTSIIDVALPLSSTTTAFDSPLFFLDAHGEVSIFRAGNKKKVQYILYIFFNQVTSSVHVASQER